MMIQYIENQSIIAFLILFSLIWVSDPKKVGESKKFQGDSDMSSG